MASKQTIKTNNQTKQTKIHISIQNRFPIQASVDRNLYVDENREFIPCSDRNLIYQDSDRSILVSKTITADVRESGWK